MLGTRAGMDVEDLLKIVLVLVAVLVALEIVDLALGILFGPLKPLVGVVIFVLIVLWFLDYI
jgi:purine-cytosine permease-like protein